MIIQDITRLPLLATMAFACVGSAQAFEIQIDYSLDDNGFFDSPESRAALRAICDFYETVITDELAAIDPTTWKDGESWTAFRQNPVTELFEIVENLVIPENTYVLYAGGTTLNGRSASGVPNQPHNVVTNQADGQQRLIDQWTLVTGRGQDGADRFTEPTTDFAPWGGTLIFDTGRTWNFSTTSPDNTEDLEFLPVALHEIGHALGIGTAPTWTRHIDGLTFIGPNSTELFGETVPLVENFHWADDVRSTSLSMFGIPAGVEAIPIMNRFSPPANATAFRGLSELDLAALADIGWEVQAPEPEPEPLGPSEPVIGFADNLPVITFATEVGKIYTIERTASLTADWATKQTIEGDGTSMTWSDPEPNPTRGFYRIITADN